MRKLIVSIIGTGALMFSQSSQAKIVEKNIIYKSQDKEFEGFIAYDTAGAKLKPGVLVTHDWMGITDRTKEEARSLAQKGYVAFAVDVYGKGIRPADTKAAGELAGKFKADRDLLRKNMNLALESLKTQKGVNTQKIAAIGFCFGGTAVVELARSGANINAVVSFHGGLDSPKPEDGKNIKAKVLALHGAIDPFVKEADLNAFEAEMKKFNIDYQLVKYGGAVHSFTNKSAGNDVSSGSAYNASADLRSHKAMDDFFKEIF